MSLSDARKELRSYIHPEGASKMAYYFKTEKGAYAAHDQFIGVTRGKVRRVAKKYADLLEEEIHSLLYSPIHEERLLALLIRGEQFKKGNSQKRKEIYKDYLTHINQVNNWDLVDFSAPNIVGASLFNKEESLLDELVNDESLWKRRIAIVATFYFIGQKEIFPTLRLAEKLLNDPEDLIHKAAGWMLREVGKVSSRALTEFLDKHVTYMPRTMLRYSLERLAPDERSYYMNKK